MVFTENSVDRDDILYRLVGIEHDTCNDFHKQRLLKPELDKNSEATHRMSSAVPGDDVTLTKC